MSSHSTVPKAQTSAGSCPGLPASTSGASQRGFVMNSVLAMAEASMARLRLKSATWRGRNRAGAAGVSNGGMHGPIEPCMVRACCSEQLR